VIYAHDTDVFCTRRITFLTGCRELSRILRCGHHDGDESNDAGDAIIAAIGSRISPMESGKPGRAGHTKIVRAGGWFPDP
jgi:hypothetical protein